MKTYEAVLRITVDDDLSESEVDELFTNLDIESSVATIHDVSVEHYTKV